MRETMNPIESTPASADGGQRIDAPANDAFASRNKARREDEPKPLPDDALIILPVRNVVLFPGLVMPLSVGRERSRAAAQEALRLQRPLGILLQNSPEVDEPGPDDLHWVGTTANVVRYVTTDGTNHAILKGEQRFRVLQFLEGYPFTVARVQLIEESKLDDPEVEGRARALRGRAREILDLLPQVPSEVATAFQGVETPSLLADFIAGMMDVSALEKQALLETFDLRTRLDRILGMLAHRIEVLKVSRDIEEKTRESLGDANRKHLLREQKRAIEKELGEGEEGADADLAELAKAIADAKMPEEVDKQARKELKRLERMPEAAAEYSMIRSYLEWLIELPWGDEAQPPIDIAEARRILDEDHYGLEKIKRRILEHLAVRKLNPNGKSPILCFVGPPGVGKTSLGQSIARATGRKFARVSLGGVHDEAEIRGHRRTYVGALPGNIVQSLRKVETRNAVMMLDEIDKLGAGGFHGDPASAMLEVLDPEQNSTFRDNYLAVPFDLSRVMFIATANVLDTIPGPLRDRMEVIQLPGYTAQEKLQIARRYLLARQLSAAGLSAEHVEIDDGALLAIIHDYTREAGVRNLEREIASVMRRDVADMAVRKRRRAVVDDVKR
ncbi:MAG TPA: endopeptidase La, partial [Usitatibacter sp.]